MTPFVVDANVMNYFQVERLRGDHGITIAAINAISNHGYIALDVEGHYEAEWMSCAAGVEPLALKDWIADMLQSEKIQLHPYNCDSMFRELNALGVPKNDHKWVRLARSVPAQYIVTEDIDLFDPSKKNQTAAIKSNIKIKRKGPVARHLRRNYNVEVVCSQHVSDICLAIGAE